MGTKKINGNLDVSGSITSEGYAVESVKNKVSSIDSQSTNTQYPSAKAVYDEIQEVIEKAEGKSDSFVLSYDATVTGTYEDYSYMDVNGDLHDFSSASQFEQWLEGKTCLNSVFNSNNNTITLVESDKNSPTKYLIINGDSKPILALVSYLYAIVKKGYIFLVTELDVADRWVSSYFETTPEVDIVLSKMETSKVDLSGYPTKAGNETITGHWTFTDLVLGANSGFELQSGTWFLGDLKIDGSIIPFVTNDVDLGTSSYTWKNLYLSGNLEIGSDFNIKNGSTNYIELALGSIIAFQTFRPNATNSKDLGSASFAWKDIYLSGSINLASGSKLDYYDGYFRFNSHVRATGDNTYDLGSSTVRWRNLFLSNLINPNSDSFGISLPDTAGYTQNHAVLVSNEDIDLGNYTLKAISLGNTVIDAEAMTLDELYSCLQHDSQSGISTGIVTFNASNYPNLKGIWAICATLSASTPISISFWGKCLTSDYYLNKFTISRTAAESAFLSDYYSQVEADKVFIDSYSNVSLTVGDLAQEENQGYVKIKWRRTNDSPEVSEFKMRFAVNTGTQVVALTLFYPDFNQYEYIATIDADTPLNTLLNNLTTYGTGNIYDLGSSSVPWRDLYLGNAIKFASQGGYIGVGTGIYVQITSSNARFDINLIAWSDNSRDIGNGTTRWKDIYFAGSLKDGTRDASLLELYAQFNPNEASANTEIKWSKMLTFSLSADTTFTFEAVKTGCLNEYKAIITNSGASPITITLPSGTTIVSNDDGIVISSNTFTLPSGVSVELNCINQCCAIINWQAQ